MKLIQHLRMVAMVAAFCVTAAHLRGEVRLTTLVSFNGTNGANPSAGLVVAKDGNFYGTTVYGGNSGYGSIFRLSVAGTFTNIFSFGLTNGAGPRAALATGADENLYGTAYYGGSGNFGTAFKMSTNGAFVQLVSFDNNNGGYPIAGFLRATDDFFYSTTALGGSNSGGTVIRMTAGGLVTNLISFSMVNPGGYSPYAGLVQGKDGSFYGTTFQGGTNNHGTVFRLTTNGLFTALYSFTGGYDGDGPYGALVEGGDANLYGTTFYGGTNASGTIFRLTTNGVVVAVFSFGITNGANPQGALVRGDDGSFYGTTVYGGLYTNQFGNGYGTIFKLATNGSFTTLLSFAGTNGANPQAALVQGADGSFYGTTANGGANSNGTIFRLSLVPPPYFESATQTNAMLKALWSATVGQAYQVQYTTNLSQINWSNWGNIILATNSPMTLFDSTGSDQQRFYRIVLLP